jgi:hypothetical protein
VFSVLDQNGDYENRSTLRPSLFSRMLAAISTATRPTSYWIQPSTNAGA